MRNNYTKRSKYRAHHRERPNYNPQAGSEHYVPDARTRASAQKNLDKYLGLARDASASGDRILAEHYFQHADHYYRITHAGLPSAKQSQQPSSQSPEAQNSVVIDVEVEPVEPVTLSEEQPSDPQEK